MAIKMEVFTGVNDELKGKIVGNLKNFKAEEHGNVVVKAKSNKNKDKIK